MLILASRIGATVFGLRGGSLEREALKRGLTFRSLTLGELLCFRGTFLTVRSWDTLLALMAARITGSNVVRLNFTDRRILWDAFVDRVVPLTRLGWIEEVLPDLSKGRGWKLCVVSRLKLERGVDRLLDILSRLRLDHRLYVIGGGDRSLLKGRVIHIHRKVDRFMKLLARMDIMVYPSAGTDKSCRAVLEAMAAGVAVVSLEDRTWRYVDHHVGIQGGTDALERLLTLPAVVRRMQVNAMRRAGRFLLRRAFL